MSKPPTRTTHYVPKIAPELRRLKWLAVLAPVVFLGAIEALRQLIFPDLFASWPGYLILVGIVLLGTLIFAETIFNVIGAMQAHLARQNQELLSLHEAGLAITGQLDLETVLQKVVDEARELVDAHYGALTLLSVGGEVEAFLVSGMSIEEQQRIGPLPSGHGLLGVVLTEGHPLRSSDIENEPGALGFPPHHPVMRSLLAVPILSHGDVLGSLYVTEKQGAPAFDPDDQERLERFATQAALAIENARLHHRVQALAISEERERIAREMHDSLAQVLGYVNTKAQAAQEFLRGGQDRRASDQIGQLAQAARDAYADVRENILGLRTTLAPGRDFLDTLRDYLLRWQDQSGIAVELDAPDEPEAIRLTPLAEIQLLRIIQEALANVRKHAGASQASVRLASGGGWIDGVIEDNGQGFDPETIGRTAFPRFGLATMRERAESVGGSLELRSVPGEGTRVQVRIPEATTIMTGASEADGMLGPGPGTEPRPAAQARVGMEKGAATDARRHRR